MIMGKRHALTTRLTALFASISTVILLLLGLLIGELAEHHFEELDRDLLQGKLELLQNALGKVDSYPALDAVTEELQKALVGHHGLSVTVQTTQGKIIFASGEAQFATTLQGSEADALIAWTDSGGRPFRGMSVLAPTKIREDPNLIAA
ncbi:MAG: two-component system OmpR family heavy metal sensor histidine kinase CusS, partial [Rhodospirillaceae bacterium]